MDFLVLLALEVLQNTEDPATSCPFPIFSKTGSRTWGVGKSRARLYPQTPILLPFM